MRTTKQMREYQRTYRANKAHRERNKAQGEAVKTVGGRQKYFACDSRPPDRSFGVFAFSPSRGSRNGVPCHYTL